VLYSKPRSLEKCPPELILLPEPIPFLGENRRTPHPDEIEDSPIQFEYGVFIVDWDELVQCTEDDI
jgi:hypothetical protein